jgi:deoxyxylulose-5-phosphate synthase
MEKNQVNSGTLNTLKYGEVLLISARKIKGDKIQLEFGEVMQKLDGPVNAVSKFNRSDARFGNKARRAWVSGVVADITEDLGIDFSDRNDGWELTSNGETLELNVLNPIVDGERCRIIITETTKGDDYQIANREKTAKRKGKEGEYILFNGENIYSKTSITFTNDNTDEMHTLLEADVENVDTETGEVTMRKSMVTDEYGL